MDKDAKKPAEGNLVVAGESPEKASKAIQTALTNYMAKDHVNDFNKWPSYQKLALLQTVPEPFVKTREVGGKPIPYIDHTFAEKALNFAFTFKYDAEIIDKKLTENVGSKGQKVYDAQVEMKFTFTFDDGSKVVRSVFSGHRSYENPATTPADALKSAVSKAYTVVARTFGIGANLKYGKKVMKFEDAESEALAKAGEDRPAPAPVQKSFGAPAQPAMAW